MVIFKQERNWKLFDPEEGKSYKTHINHLGFADCRSLASCGNWVLVTDDKAYLYMVNPFTLKIIDLPPLNSYGTYKILDNCPIHFDYGFRERGSGNCPVHSQYIYRQGWPVRVDTAVLWVDERTKDYLVVWKSRVRDRLRFCMKGDEEWLEIPSEYGSIDHMVYKDKKLYLLSEDGDIGILDFSQDFPREVPNHLYVNRPFNTNYGETRMKLTTSGDVVMIRRVCQSSETIGFEVYKMNSTTDDWEKVDSLDEEELLVWDLSVTLPTKGVSGIKKDSIYFCEYRDDYGTFFLDSNTYEIPTRRIERSEQCSHLLGFSDARLFLPCFGVGE